MAAEDLRSAAAATSPENPKQAWDQGPVQGDEKAKPSDIAEKPANLDTADKGGEPGKHAHPRFQKKGSTLPFGTEAKWQWEHRTGFLDYSKEESDRIERQFQYGVWMMRLKSGKGKRAKPREIFFYDMVQFDPASNSARNIRRCPEETRWERTIRRFNTYWNAIVKGEEHWWKSKSKQYYEEQRQDRDDLSEEELLAEKFKLDSAWYWIASSYSFHGISMTAVLLNAFWLLIDADYNDGTTFADTPWVFIIVDNIFCVYFLLELFFRFKSFKTCRVSLQDQWFVLDLLLVVLMIFETWILQLGIYLVVGTSDSSASLDQFGVLRPLRLLRLARITRLFKVFPQLFVLVKGMTQAMRSLVYTLLMLFVLMFMFGVILKSVTESELVLQEELKLGSVGGAMWMLLINGTFMDAVGDVLNALVERNGWYAAIMLAFIFLSNLTMLNMLIGILCEVVTRVGAEESDRAAKAELETRLLDLLECYDVEDDRHIRKPEFAQLMSNLDMQMILRDHGIDSNDVAKLEDTLFDEEAIDDEGHAAGQRQFKGLSFDDFLEKVIQLRGGNMATVTDIVELRGYLNRKFTLQEKLFATSPEDLPTPCKPRHSATAPALSQAAATASSSCAPSLPGQIGSPATGSEAADMTFQEAVLSQLSLIRVSQEMLRGEVNDLHSKVQALQQAQNASKSGPSEGANWS